MELHQLECFLELSKYQNVSLTAEQLNISQPALSKTIGLLEAELGVKLFDRVGRRIRLNEHGEAFVKYAEQSLESLREGTRTVRNLDSRPRGTISIGLFSYMNLIAECLRDFMEKYPLVRFEIYSSKSQYTIDHFDNLDFTLSSSLNDQPILSGDVSESCLIAKENYVLCIAPELLSRTVPGVPETDLTLADFHETPFLVMANNLMFSDITFTLCQTAGFMPHVIMQTNDFATKLHMTSLGSCASFIPEICIPVFRKYREDLCFLTFSEISASRVIRLSRKKAALRSQACQLFWHYVQDYYPAK